MHLLFTYTPDSHPMTEDIVQKLKYDHGHKVAVFDA